MALRCLLFSSDEGAAEPICQVLAELGVEGESCVEGVAAVERVTSQSFQIVIIDWDQQPEAGFLLKTARERKASERPLTLAIVSDDASVPKALQAGANSILRKPLLVNQVKDTLTTARDLLRAKHESATAAMAAAAGASSGTSSGTMAPLPASTEPAGDKALRAGEFLNSSGAIPGTQFDTESEMKKSLEQSAVGEVDPLDELEPMAASVAHQKPALPEPLPPSVNEPRGLQWYLNARAATAPQPPAPSAAPPAPAKPELLGFDQSPSHSEAAPEASPDRPAARIAPPAPTAHHHEQEQKAEAKLFAYISGEKDESEEEARLRPSFRFGKPIVAALILASCAIAVAPQAPWHPAERALIRRGQVVLHAWLNPQPNTTAPAPESHENFGRAGDEYKLPVAENIPDATTDPSQIRVVPMVDPTAKKTNSAANPDQTTGPTDGTTTTPIDPAQPSGGQIQEQTQEKQTPENQPPQMAPDTAPPANGPAATGTAPSTTAPAVSPAVSRPAEPPHSGPPAVVAPSSLSVPLSSTPAHQVQPKNVPPSTGSTPSNVPSSLKSQIASMTPEASGNKPIEAALPSIEPVVVPEATERALLAEQPAVAYPATAKGQQGTVILQVLVGRDGTVQDAKFIQGSLAFARAAIDGVKLWKFKPYMMNGRPASVQTTLTMTFKP
ncbi:MAG TPA: TonB family protein [Candidatus Sulfotelmatobacter sp.]|nr:TonB family protein [Candidatus Sulfotelmatobacter sp.]